MRIFRSQATSSVFATTISKKKEVLPTRMLIPDSRDPVRAKVSSSGDPYSPQTGGRKQLGVSPLNYNGSLEQIRKNSLPIHKNKDHI